jgi:hypothetical protein
LRGTGINITHSASGHALWIGLLSGITLGYRFWKSLGIRIEGQLGINPTRPLFEIDGVGTMHQPSVLFGRAGLGLEYYL